MKLALSSIQWAFFILAGSIVAPLAIGAAFHLSQSEMAGLLQRTFFIIGLSSLLQGLFGHRLPIFEGPAGLWWGVFLIFADLAAALKQGTFEILQTMEMALLISGALFLLMSALRLVSGIRKIFSPLVVGTYMFLLVAQLSGSFVKGILGIGYGRQQVNFTIALPAIATLIVSILLAKSKYKMLRSYSVLFGIAFGWVLFAMVGLTHSPLPASSVWISMPKPFAWGKPVFDSGIVLTSIMTALLLLTNLIASVDVVEKVVQPEQPANYTRSSIVMGINQALAGLFSTVGFVPISYTAGFILTTKMKERMPFIVGSILILAMSFFPLITLFFSSLPIPVGYATVFLSFSTMIGIGLKEYQSVIHEERKTFIIGLSLMAGMGSMFIPPLALAHVPRFLVTLMNNGLVLGVILCILLEQGMKLGRISTLLCGKK
jgi:xanthine/uracil permease